MSAREVEIDCWRERRRVHGGGRAGEQASVGDRELLW